VVKITGLSASWSMMPYNNSKQGSGSGSISSIVDVMDQKGQNAVSPDNGSSNHRGYGFSFCYVMDSLPSICGKSPDLSHPVSDDEDDLVKEKRTNDDRNHYTLQQQPASTSPVDPMNVDSYISVHLPKPIGIRFEENDSDYGGVFVADIDSKFSAAADGSIRRGYQLCAVGEKRVSGMDFDEAVMQPIVDNNEAEVTLVFFTGSAACLYHLSTGANEEWLDTFVAMNAKKQNMKNVEIEDDDSGIEIVANTTEAVREDDETSKVIVEECNEIVQIGIVEQAEQAEPAEPAENDALDLDGSTSLDELDSSEDQDFHDGTNDDFFSKVPDLSTTSFDWIAKKHLMPDIEPAEEENMDANPWLRSSQEFLSQTQTQTAEEASIVSVDEDVDETVSVEDPNDGSVASKTESLLEDGESDEGDTDNMSGDQSDGSEAAYVENVENCASPQSDASYSPSSGFVLRKDEGLPEVSEDEVLIRVDATTICTRDCLEGIRRDNNEKLKDQSWVPGHEIVGHVVRAGKKAKLLLGRKVATLLSHGGGCSRYVCIHAKDLVSLPETADSNEMVALLSTYIAAYQCLEFVQSENGMDPVGPSLDTAVSEDVKKSEESSSLTEVAGKKKSPLSGSCVLITGAGSPVGLALIDIAKNAGATVYAVSHSSHEKDIREIGVKEWYPLFRRQEWRAEWSGRMNLIVDTVGDYDNYPVFYEVMAPRGRFVRMNTTSCGKKYVPVLGEQVKVFSALKDYKGSRINNTAIDYNVFHSFNDDQELFTEDLAYLYHLLQMGKIEPRVFSKVGFDELQEEWEKVMVGGANGVVVVLPWKD